MELSTSSPQFSTMNHAIMHSRMAQYLTAFVVIYTISPFLAVFSWAVYVLCTLATGPNYPQPKLQFEPTVATSSEPADPVSALKAAILANPDIESVAVDLHDAAQSEVEAQPALKGRAVRSTRRRTSNTRPPPTYAASARDLEVVVEVDESDRNAVASAVPNLSQRESESEFDMTMTPPPYESRRSSDIDTVALAALVDAKLALARSLPTRLSNLCASSDPDAEEESDRSSLYSNETDFTDSSDDSICSVASTSSCSSVESSTSRGGKLAQARQRLAARRQNIRRRSPTGKVPVPFPPVGWAFGAPFPLPATPRYRGF